MMWDIRNRIAHTNRILLLLWSLFIALVGIFPLTNFVGHSHWEYIQWLPTADNFHSWRFLFDIAANIGIFIPLGYLLMRSSSSETTHHSHLLAASFSGILSLSIEWFQVYCHNRHPSAIDLFSNVTGGLMGASISHYRQHLQTTSPHDPTTPILPDRNLAP